MDARTALARLQAHEHELRGLGIEHLSLFGSVARGDEHTDSDVDLAARFVTDHNMGVFRFIQIEQRIADLLGVKVDLVMEPSSAPRLQAQIDRDRVDVF